jgi:hypothetical protein
MFCNNTYLKQGVKLKAPGTRITKAISFFKPGPQKPQRGIIGNAL